LLLSALLSQPLLRRRRKLQNDISSHQIGLQKMTSRFRSPTRISSRLIARTHWIQGPGRGEIP
jgi:hypothetical protein